MRQKTNISLGNFYFNKFDNYRGYLQGCFLCPRYGLIAKDKDV